MKNRRTHNPTSFSIRIKRLFFRFLFTVGVDFPAKKKKKKSNVFNPFTSLSPPPSAYVVVDDRVVSRQIFANCVRKTENVRTKRHLIVLVPTRVVTADAVGFVFSFFFLAFYCCARPSFSRPNHALREKPTHFGERFDFSTVVVVVVVKNRTSRVGRIGLGIFSFYSRTYAKLARKVSGDKEVTFKVGPPVHCFCRKFGRPSTGVRRLCTDRWWANVWPDNFHRSQLSLAPFNRIIIIRSYAKLARKVSGQQAILCFQKLKLPKLNVFNKFTSVILDVKWTVKMDGHFIFILGKLNHIYRSESKRVSSTVLKSGEIFFRFPNYPEKNNHLMSHITL